MIEPVLQRLDRLARTNDADADLPWVVRPARVERPVAEYAEARVEVASAVGEFEVRLPDERELHAASNRRMSPPALSAVRQTLSSKPKSTSKCRRSPKVTRRYSGVSSVAGWLRNLAIACTSWRTASLCCIRLSFEVFSDSNFAAR